MVISWLRTPLHFPPTPLTMELTKSFPPADALVETLQSIDYKKHLNQYMDAVEIACAFIAAIATIIWEKLQVMKFQTPEIITKYFYFSVNMIAEPGDEIVGLSVGNRYIGLYANNIVWGILNENGVL